MRLLHSSPLTPHSSLFTPHSSLFTPHSSPEFNGQTRPQEMVVRGHPAGKGLNERSNAGNQPRVLDPLVGVRERDLRVARKIPGEVHPGFPLLFVHRFASSALGQL